MVVQALKTSLENKFLLHFETTHPQFIFFFFFQITMPKIGFVIPKMITYSIKTISWHLYIKSTSNIVIGAMGTVK